MGDKIKNLRKLQRVSLRSLAEKSGISKSTLSDVENDKSSPTINTLEKIADALGCTLMDLVGVDKLKKELTDIDLSVIPTKDLIEELNKRNDFKLTSKSSL